MILRTCAAATLLAFAVGCGGPAVDPTPVADEGSGPFGLATAVGNPFDRSAPYSLGPRALQLGQIRVLFCEVTRPLALLPK